MLIYVLCLDHAHRNLLAYLKEFFLMIDLIANQHTCYLMNIKLELRRLASRRLLSFVSPNGAPTSRFGKLHGFLIRKVCGQDWEAASLLSIVTYNPIHTYLVHLGAVCLSLRPVVFS